MKRKMGVDLFLLVGLTVLLWIPMGARAGAAAAPKLEVSGLMPLTSSSQLLLIGAGFEPRTVLGNFGAVARIELETKSGAASFLYRGYNLPELSVQTDGQGNFSLPITLSFLTGVHGLVQIALYDQGRVIATDFVPIRDSGKYAPSELDAVAGTLFFLDPYAKGGNGELPVDNGDDVPLTSNAAGDWSGTFYGVNLERYTTSDGTGTPDVYTHLTNDISFSGGNLTSSSSAIVAGLVAPTYRSIRMTVGVWDPPNYGSLAWNTTQGTSQAYGWLNTADETQPQVSSANATSLTAIVVTFSEAVTTPSGNPQAIDNWTVTFNGNKAVSALSPLGSGGTTTITLTVANMGDLGATPTVQFNTGNGEFEDIWGNDCGSTTSPHITATDGIVPAAPALTAPTGDTFLEGGSVSWTANAGAGTDNSLAGLEFQGSTNGSSWDSLDSDASNPYSGSYALGTQYNYYRAQAYDTNNNTANSSATANLQDAHHLHLTTIPASTPANVESGQWTVTVHDNYGNPENISQTVALSTTSSWGAFRAVSGGPSVNYINILNNSSGNFYYIDTQVGTPWIYAINVALADDSTEYTITSNSQVASIRIRTASAGGGSETGALEIAGAANGGAYNVTAYMFAAGYNSLGEYVTDVGADWSVNGTLTETGGSYFENDDPTISNRYIAISSTNRSGKVIAAYGGFTDSTGTVTVDATKPAVVQGFNITEDQVQEYVNAVWTNTSSYDDGNNAASGNVADFDIRFASTIINSEAGWNAATTVGTTGKPASFNNSSSWRIYMAGFPAGYYFYAIKTVDPQGYWSNIGLGCYTNSPDYSLPVTLSSFTAAGGYGKIIVSWSTESEVDALGFRLLRAEDETMSNAILVASYDINPELLCQGGTATGYDYSFVDRQEVQPEVVYYYQLEAVDVNGRAETSQLQAWAAALPLPAEYSLGPNFPNPFNPSTQFEIKLPQSGAVNVLVYDLHGREISRILDQAYLEAGVYRLSWNGADGRGYPMPSGLYLCRLQARETSRTMKMMLIK